MKEKKLKNILIFFFFIVFTLILKKKFYGDLIKFLHTKS